MAFHALEKKLSGGKKKKKPKTHSVNLGKKGKFNVHPGKLHKALGIPADQKIGEARLHKALHSSNPAIRRMAKSGIGLSHMHH